MSKRIFFKGAVIIDGTGAAASKAGLLIEGDKILEIVKASAESTIEKSAKCIDLSGKFIMPGMINAHVHVCFDGDSPDSFGVITAESSNTTAIRSVDNLKRLLSSGVTWFRDMGGRDYVDIDLRARCRPACRHKSFTAKYCWRLQAWAGIRKIPQLRGMLQRQILCIHSFGINHV